MKGKRPAKTIEEIAFNQLVGARICRLRKTRNLRQAELAGAAGISGGQLYFYEIGVQRCPIYRLVLIAHRLGVSVESLIP